MVVVVLLAAVLPACKGYKHGDLQLDGDCNIVSIVLNDSLVGKVIPGTHTVDVKVLEVYPTSEIVVTNLQLSDGATADLLPGMVLRLDEPRMVRVVNGNTYIDWTIRVRHEDASIARFKVAGVPGIISSDNQITIYISADQDIHALMTSATLSQDATIEPKVNTLTDFSHPVTYTVTDGYAKRQYVVTVKPISNPEVLYVSPEDGMDMLAPEELKACQTLLEQVPSLYASFRQLREGRIDVSKCKVIWWHGHNDEPVRNAKAFEDWAAEAVASKKFLEEYLSNGGSIFLSRFATYLPAYLTIGSDLPSNIVPNNCFGDPESKSWAIDGEWGFAAFCPHPIYNGVLNADNNVQLLAKGYLVSNSVAQWAVGPKKEGGEWEIKDLTDFTIKTGATAIGVNGDGYPVAWEWARTAEHGGILCIGSGAFDFYSPAEVYDSPHENVDKLVLNIINYLKQ